MTGKTDRRRIVENMNATTPPPVRTVNFKVGNERLIKVLPAASARLGGLLKKQGRAEHGGLRVAVVGGGCSGLQYKMDLVDGPADRDIMVESGGVRVVIVDCVTLLVNNVFNLYPENTSEAIIEEAGMGEIEELVDCIAKHPATYIIVTNEVGMDVVPPTVLGRVYRDLLGRANQVLAAHADQVLLMVAGLPLKIKPASGT